MESGGWEHPSQSSDAASPSPSPSGSPIDSQEEVVGPYEIETVREGRDVVICPVCGLAVLIDQSLLRCHLCLSYTHGECATDVSPLPLAGDRNYQYTCHHCNAGQDSFERLTQSWENIIHTTIFNLLLRDGDEKKFFRWREDICSFIDRNWGTLCYGRARTATWFNTVASYLSTHPTIFKSGMEIYGQNGYWTLRKIPRCLEDLLGLTGGAPRHRKGDRERLLRSSKKSSRVAEKRSIREREESGLDETTKMPVKPSSMPGTTAYPKLWYQELFTNEETGPVRVSNIWRAAQLTLLEDLMTIVGEKGYRTARATHGTNEGTYFFEITVNIPSPMPNAPFPPATRLGIVTKKGDLQAPVGYDEFGFGFRCIDGSIFHESYGKPFGVPYGVGDTIGFLVHMGTNEHPERTDEDQDLGPLPVVAEPKEEENTAKRMRHASAPKKTTEEPKHIRAGSSLRIYVNGKEQGVAAVDLLDDKWFPAASLYMGASVEFVFGPEFVYPPSGVEFRAFSELGQEPKHEEEEQQQQQRQQQQQQQQQQEKEGSLPSEGLGIDVSPMIVPVEPQRGGDEV